MTINSKVAWLLNLEEQIGNLVPSPHEGLGTALKQALQSLGYTVRNSNDAGHLGDFSVLISADLDETRIQQLAQYPRERCFLIATEPPLVMPSFYSPVTRSRFGKIFLLLDRFVDNQNYFKIYHLITQKNPISQEQEVPFEKRKLCCMVQGNKFFRHFPGELYTERKNLAEFFTQLSSFSKEFDVYGVNWQGLKSWKGMTKTNKALLGQYKFAICYENTGDELGFITERIFNSLFARNVPVYLGAPNIHDYVPKDCFIDARDFGGQGEAAQKRIWDFMTSMDKSTYQNYISAGQNYLTNNQKIKLFSLENMVNTIIDQVKKLGI